MGLCAVVPTGIINPVFASIATYPDPAGSKIISSFVTDVCILLSVNVYAPVSPPTPNSPVYLAPSM